MNTALFVEIALIIIALLFVGLALLVPYALARKRKYGFTFIPQGEILPVMGGESCVGYLSHLEGWDVMPDGRVNKVDTRTSLGFWGYYHKWFGVYFYGVPPFRQLWEGEFSWNKWMKQGGKDVLVERAARSINSIYFQFPYGYRFGGLETKPASGTTDHRGSLVIPVYLEMLFDVRAANVHTMAFPEVTWLMQLVAMMEGVIRPEVGNSSFEDLIAPTPEKKNLLIESMMRVLCGEKGKLPGSNKPYDPVALARKQFLDPSYTHDEINWIIHNMPVVIETGVFVTRIDIRSIGIDASEAETARLLQLVNGPAEAAKKAEARVTEAEAEATAIRKVGEAEGAAARARVEAYGSAGPEIGAALAHGDSLTAALGNVPGLKTLVLGAQGTSVILPGTDDPAGSGSGGPQWQKNPNAAPKQTNPPQPQQQKPKKWTSRRSGGRGGNNGGMNN